MADSKSKYQVEISAIDNASRVINGIESKFNSLGKTIDKSLAVIGVAGVASFIGILKKGVKEAAAEEQSMKRLSTAIESIGKNYSSVSGEVNSLLKSQQKFTQFADDQSAGALATLIQLTRNYNLSMKALVVTEDLAASGLFDLDSAATAVGKALTGNVMLLQRMGIKLKEGDDVLAVLSSRFGGTAAKNVDTFSGRLQQLSNTVSDVFETLGGPLLEPLKNAAMTLRDSLASDAMQEKIRAFGQSIADSIPKAVDSLVKFSNWVITHGNTILNFFKALIAFRVVSWAVSLAASLVQLAPVISSAFAAAISPTGLIVLAAASGTTIGLTIGHAIAKAIRDSRPQDAIPDVRKNFIGPPAFAKFPLIGSGLTAQGLASREAARADANIAARAAADAALEAQRAMIAARVALENWGASIEGSRFSEGRAIIGRLGDRTRDRGGIRMRAGRGGGRLGGDTLFDINGSGGIAGAESIDTLAIQRAKDAEDAYRKFMTVVGTVSNYTMQAMSSITNALVSGIERGTLRLSDLFKALKSAILSIIADLMAKLATAGILSLLFPSIGFMGALSGVFRGGFGGGRTQSIRPAPIGAIPAPVQSSFGGMHVTLIVQGDLVNDEEKIRRFIDRGVTQAQRGGNKLSRYLSK